MKHLQMIKRLVALHDLAKIDCLFYIYILIAIILVTKTEFHLKMLSYYLSFFFQGTIVVHSLAGGTGSGLGSHLVEKLRETYPLAHVLSVAIAPHTCGDCPLQHYNSLLSLASLQWLVLV